ncbi:Predicted ATPase [bacterium A37T11]|nr:Predicted ATPase [bacterium A37T11]
MEQINHNAIIITGGPGMGKTSIVGKLSEIGYFCVKESGRHIIQEQLKKGGTSLPWADKNGFADEMLKMGKRDYKNALCLNSLVFFDRAIPDVIGYLKLCHLPIHKNVRRSARCNRYYNTVFITPPWEEIYLNDAERKQSFEEAIATYEMMFQVYTDLNYAVVEIPRTTVEKRIDFIFRILKEKNNLNF